MENSKPGPPDEEEGQGAGEGIRWEKLGWDKKDQKREVSSFLPGLLERVNLHPIFPEVLRFHILNDRFQIIVLLDQLGCDDPQLL